MVLRGVYEDSVLAPGSGVCKFQGLRFGVYGLQVWALGFWTQGSEIWACSECRVWVQGLQG